MTRRMILMLCGIGVACGDLDRDQPRLEPDVAVPIVTLGDDETLGEEHLFGSVSSVAIDPDGRVYVADRTTSSVRVFGQDGALLGILGGEGQGPGEFQTPLGIVFSADGDLWVRDLNRVQQFSASRAGELPDSVVRTQALSGYPNTRAQRATVQDSLYFSPGYFFPLDGGADFFYEVFAPMGIRDTVRVPVLPNLGHLRGSSYRGGRLDREQREIIASLALAPFEPRPSWQMTSRGTILVASGSEPSVTEVSADGVAMRELELPFGREAVPAEMRSDSLAALRRRLAALSIPLEEVENVSEFVRRGEVPDSLPTVRRIHEASDGRIWVEVWPRAANASDFVGFNPDGTVENYVRIPVSPAPTPPYFRGDHIVAVSVEPITRVERVVLFATNR